MVNTTDNTPTSSPPISLGELGLELGETVDALADRLGKAVFVDSLNRRVVTRFVAGEEIRKHQERKAQAQAEAEAETESKRKQARERREAARARALAAREDSSPRVEKLGLQMLSVSPDGPEGVGAVLNMTSRANQNGVMYEGAVATPRPSKLDWLSGHGEGAGSFGPSRSQLEADAKQKRLGKVHRLQQRGGGK